MKETKRRTSSCRRHVYVRKKITKYVTVVLEWPLPPPLTSIAFAVCCSCSCSYSCSWLSLLLSLSLPPPPLLSLSVSLFRSRSSPCCRARTRSLSPSCLLQFCLDRNGGLFDHSLFDTIFLSIYICNTWEKHDCQLEIITTRCNFDTEP